MPILARGCDAGHCTLWFVRVTDFWSRLERELGASYARSWARDYVVAGLGGRTVDDAIAAGVDTKVVWLAVHAELGLPASAR